ncbi:MAG: HAD family hydrolase [Thermoguttaceae bacterium]|jgi:HAD superfamily hydrolase (TIGR01509 family)
MSSQTGAIAVAFDMDGLMFDTETVYWKCASILLGRRGYEYTHELNDSVMGRPPEHTFRTFIAAHSLSEDWQTLQQESDEIFLELLNDGYETQPGLMELLDLLEERRIPRGVCTSSARRVANEVLKKDGIDKRLNFVLTSDDVERGKPDPQVYQLAAQKFGVEPARMLVLEDSSAGAASAKAAGAPCCMLRSEHNSNADFSTAVAVVERLDAHELIALLADEAPN